jgi:peptide/nickel transport system ATP-binding protein
VLHDITFRVAARSCLAIVGESGSGKTTLARCLAGLNAQAGGKTLFHDQPLAPKSRQRPRDVRRRIQYIFQNPYASLNPSRSIGTSLAIALRTLDPAAARDGARRIHQVLEQVALPAGMAKRYPNELSGGQRQRVAIARALLAEPELLICDEITSALDVSVQAVIVNLLADLRDQFGLSYLFISHDLAVVAQLSDRVAVMYRGRICESGTPADLLATPRHPYTRMLLDAVADAPQADADVPAGEIAPAGGCVFAARCPHCLPSVCQITPPELRMVSFSHQVACHFDSFTGLRPVVPVAPVMSAKVGASAPTG